MRKDEMATGPHIRLIHGLNFPSFVGRDRSTICPIVTSVTASTNRAAIIRSPTTAAGTPITSV